MFELNCLYLHRLCIFLTSIKHKHRYMVLRSQKKTRVGDNSERVFFEVPRCMSLVHIKIDILVFWGGFFENVGF